MALSTLAEWTGSAIISSLIDTAYLYLGEHMLPADTEVELNKLKIALPKIKAVMNVSEALKLRYPNSGVNEWLNNFKEAFLATEDVLDELKYWELADKVKAQDHVSASPPSIGSSLKRKFLGSNTNGDTLGKLREAVKMLDMAATDVGDFFQFVTVLNGPLEPHSQASVVSGRETSSILTESKVFGRETEKAAVIEWLKKPASHAHISSLSIVGPGGLGKTTLAQLILEEIGREDHFGEIIWVCVSTSFRVEEITRKILEKLNETSHVGESLNSLQMKLKKKVLSKKVLLILDDVWNENRFCDWEKLVAPLRFAQQGSRILLTTRMKSVANMLACVLNVERECLDLDGLKEPDMWSLLRKYAFRGCNPDKYRDLQKIGKDIVKKLWGSPLAAKVIGGLLNSSMTFSYWKRILRSDSLINLEQAKEVADVLQLSYLYLSVDLQECFRFCRIFHQHDSFEKSELIRMWMACGFIRKQPCGEERPEDIGEEYFNHLLRKSFFEHSEFENRYFMHDLMYELVRNVSKGECCIIEPDNKLVDVPITVQHVSVHISKIKQVFHLRNLRTLIITGDVFDDPTQSEIPNHALKETLRLLKIDVIPGFELPKENGCLIHLRYLHVVGYEDLPPHWIYKLHHLQVLQCYGNPFETNGFAKLVSLRYMKIPLEMMQQIKGVHKLTSLQELIFYVGKESGHYTDEIRMLNNLQKLSIRKIENVLDPTEAINASLSKKKNLISLSLHWTQGSNCNNPEQIIDNLQPHPDLKELKIKYYQGNKSPIWMKYLPHLDLSFLKIFHCPLWEDLPSFARMPHLKKLSLMGMKEVKELDYSFDSTTDDYPFPSLEELCCENMPKWQSWAGSHTNYGFPNLRVLTIWNCPRLTELPAMPLSLFNFEVEEVGLISLPDIYNSSSITTTAPSSLQSSLREVRIINCPKLKSLNGFLQQDNLDLHAFEQLVISYCENLVQLPAGGFGKLESLKHLRIHGSPKLLADGNQRNLLPLKLQTLHLGNCGEFNMQLLESASCLPTLHSLDITNSPSITHIPCPENTFAHLRKLNIQGCHKLNEYAYMEYAQGVNHGNNMVSLKINDLIISHLSLLFIEPIKSLRFVSRCEVKDCSGMETLSEQWLLHNSSTLEHLTIWNASSLQSLPDTMVRLTALRELYIYNATLLEEMKIPELPASLLHKSIKGAGSRDLV